MKRKSEPPAAAAKSTEPKWVREVERHLFGMHVPLPPGVSPAFREGASYGFHFAQIAAVHDRHVTAPHKLSRAEAERVVAACKPVLQIIASEVLLVLTNRPLQEVPDYLKGFASGIDSYYQGDAKLATGQLDPIGSTNAWQVYHALWKNHERISGFNSVREIYDWMLAQYGQNVVGELSRFSMLCSRVGLTVRGRGRPRKI